MNYTNESLSIFLKISENYKKSYAVRFSKVQSRGVKLPPREPNPARHVPFCGPRRVSFVSTLGMKELHLLLCHNQLTFFVYRHYATLGLNNINGSNFFCSKP